MNVWVVSYFDEGDQEPTVTVFDNFNAAAKWKDVLVIERHQRVSLDECELYSNVEVF